MTTCTQANTTPFPWEKWAQLHKEEWEAEMKEAAKQAAKEDNDDTTCVQPDQADQVRGGTIGNSDSATTPPFPYWDSAEPTTETEAFGHQIGLFSHPAFSDQTAIVDEQWVENVNKNI